MVGKICYYYLRKLKICIFVSGSLLSIGALDTLMVLINQTSLGALLFACYFKEQNTKQNHLCQQKYGLTNV